MAQAEMNAIEYLNMKRIDHSKLKPLTIYIVYRSNNFNYLNLSFYNSTSHIFWWWRNLLP